MKISEGFSVGFIAIRVNKMRSLLTMLGIVIGVASVLAMIAIGDGAKQVVLEDAQKVGGANQISLYRSSHIRKGNRWVRNRSNEYFDYGDVLAIEAECPSVEGVIPRIPQWRGVLVQTEGGAETRTGYEGITPFYQIGMKWDVQSGRFISEEDIANRQKVCVLGSDVATQLFGNQDPVGKTVKIARGAGGHRGRWGRRAQDRSMERFSIVGVMEPRGRSLRFGWNLDDRVFLPLTTVQERFTGNDRVRMISVQAKNVDLIEKATEEVKAVLRKRHRNQDDFFRIWEMKKGMEQLFKISKIIKIMLGGIAGFSLLVGGIGIMNMMLVSVTERTREIGLRKAIGAKRRDILLQFLVEAIVMCSVGGLIGVGLGVGAGYGLAHIAVKIVKVIPEWPAVISTEWMVISVVFSAVIGISFGLYPAIKAARLSPIEALRTE
ncbi:MAG: ABC transporter permease [Candidatus Poribacteria bacterium]|nr:ABC transporter permease [Candidatus Poribacteria bacterium]